MRKRVLITTFSALLILTSLLSAFFLTHDKETAVPTSAISSTPEEKSGTFRYINNYTDTYFYDDKYFFGDATEYNPQLATMSFCLALSAFSVEENGEDTDFSNNCENVENLLCKELGYSGFKANDWYTKKPTTDSIAVAAANKIISDSQGNRYTIIAIAVRGGGYGKEWTSNFTLGESGDAKGFSDAKEQVLTFLKEYISERKELSGKIKFWITGFSRGAATSNLVAAEITDNPKIFGNKVKFSKKDVFAYCFATPMGALRENTVSEHGYKNIWNVIDRNDPVPYVAMRDLGFSRFGQDHYFPDIATAGDDYTLLQAQMEKFYNASPTFSETGEYSIDEFTMKKIDMLQLTLDALDKDNEEYSEKIIADDSENNWTQGRYLDFAISTLTTENIETRAAYVADFEEGIRTIIDTVHGSVFAEYPAETTKKCFAIFTDKLKGPLNIARIIYGLFTKSSTLTAVITDLLIESANECGISIPPEKAPELEKLSKAAVSLVANFAIKHPNLTVTLLSNIKHIGSGHNHELYFAWLKTEDKNYTLPHVSSVSQKTFAQ